MYFIILKKKNLFLITLMLFSFDLLSKVLISNFMHNSEELKIIPSLIHFTLVKNHGAAFSLFESFPLFLKFVSLIISIILILIIFLKNIISHQLKIGLVFLLAGSLGNGLDRWLYGYVIDFINITIINFPIFNLADIYINIGILFILYDNLVKSNHRNIIKH